MADSDAQASTVQTDSEKDFLVSARQLYHDDYEAARTNTRNMGDDIRFYANDQWLNEDRVEREAQNRPVITEDHLTPAVRQITNDMRMNKPALKVRPVDSVADPEVAKIYEGLIRNIEQQSFAATGNAYVKGGENAVICGQGAFRIITEYASDSGFDQNIKIIPIRGALSVVWDSDAQSPTRDDAKRCWILTWMAKTTFEATYPGKSSQSWERPSQVSQEWYKDWNRRDEVLVAEYFWKKPKTKTIWRMALDQRVVDVTDLDDDEKSEIVQRQAETALSEGNPLPDPPYEAREIESDEVWRAVINGADILEEARKWPGRYIPVINVMGEEVFLDDSRTIRGLVRVGKDSQRMINYHNSAAIEHVSLSPKQPYLGTTAHFAGLEREWQIANRQNAPYLRYKVDPSSPQSMPTRAPAPEIPAALLTLKQEAVSGLQATTNVYPSATGAQSNEISGVAIQKRDTQGDVANFHYVDNLNHSVAYCGKQLIDLIPKVYDGQRVIRVLGEDDAEEMIEINALQPDGSLSNDLSAGQYDLVMVPGPSFSTKRAEAASFLEKFMQAAAPEERAMVMDLLVKNLDLPGSDELYERLRKAAVARGIAEPDEEAGEQAPEPKPDPAEMLAQAELTKAEADLINANTKAAQNQTSALKNAADARKSYAESEGQQLENVEALVKILVETGALEQAMRGQIQAVVEQTLANVLETRSLPINGGF